MIIARFTHHHHHQQQQQLSDGRSTWHCKGVESVRECRVVSCRLTVDVVTWHWQSYKAEDRIVSQGSEWVSEAGALSGLGAGCGAERSGRSGHRRDWFIVDERATRCWARRDASVLARRDQTTHRPTISISVSPRLTGSLARLLALLLVHSLVNSFFLLALIPSPPLHYTWGVWNVKVWSAASPSYIDIPLQSFKCRNENYDFRGMFRSWQSWWAR